MSELPLGWKLTTLENVCSQISDGTHKTPNYVDEGVPFISIANITPFKPIDWTSYVRFITREEHEQLIKRVKPQRDDVLITRIGTLGKAKLVDVDIEFSIFVGLGLIRPIKEIVEPRYLEAWMNSTAIRELSIEKATGSGRQTLALQETRILPIPLPPLDEQKRIVKKLDTLLARVDSCQTHLERVPQILKRFRQSVLAAATSGRLTEDWREAHPNLVSGDEVINSDREKKEELLLKNKELAKKKSTLFSDINAEYLFDIPSGWAFTSWGKISEWITYGFTRPMPSTSEGKKLVTAKDVQNFSLELESAGFTTKKAFDDLSEKDRPLRGDLLITKDGTIGRAVLVQTDEPFCINQSVAVCWLRTTQMNKKYLEIIANADFTQRFVKDMAQGMAIQHLSITDFSQCPVPVPSLEEQAEIVRRVEKLFAYAERLEARYTSASEHVERLTPSLLAKAFRGELVEQDPNDESAEKLLERIKTAIAKAPKESKKSERRNTMKNTKSKQDGKRISIVQALQEAGKALSSDQLFAAAGFPSDAEPDLVEEFFVEIRDALKNKQITRKRKGDLDWFSLAE